MGLDQFAYTVPDTGDLSLIDCPRNIPDDWSRMSEEERSTWRKAFPRISLMYWRKHPDLHGWMELLYRSRGGTGDFNCRPVRLLMEDLDALQASLDNDKLPVTEGFFFGTSRADERYQDYAFIDRARTAIESGWAVYYDSWW